MWFCPALSSTFFYLKQTEIVVVVVVVETEMQNFDLKFSGGASPDRSNISTPVNQQHTQLSHKTMHLFAVTRIHNAIESLKRHLLSLTYKNIE